MPGGVIKKREQMPLLALEERASSFKEVELGFDREMAERESARCLNCAEAECVKGCPLGIRMPEFIGKIKEEKGREALGVIEQSQCFPSICGRICQHELQCEKNCILGKGGEAVAIGALERYAADNFQTTLEAKEKNGKRVAVIGSGPSGLTVAKRLALDGYSVKVFEAGSQFGGVIKYGVPEFRLPRRIVEKEIKRLLELGVEFEPHAHVNDEMELNALRKEFDAVFWGTGVGEARKLDIKGSRLAGVYPAIKFLINVNMKLGPGIIEKGEKVVIVGSGHVGVDAARTVRRLGGEATVITQEARENLRIGMNEIREAEEEGVRFMFGCRPVRLLGKIKVEKIRVRKVKAGKGNGVKSRARNVKETEKGNGVKYAGYGKAVEIPADKVIIAVGQKPKINRLLLKKLGARNGLVKADDDARTSMKGVFAAGDCVTGPKTVIEAIAMGNTAASAIEDYLEGKK